MTHTTKDEQEFRRLADKANAASDAEKVARIHLARAIARMVALGMEQWRICEITGYSRETVRRIARDHGVGPATKSGAPAGQPRRRRGATVAS